MSTLPPLTETLDQDWLEAVPPPVLKLGGAALAIAGFFTTGLAVQIGSTLLHSWWHVVSFAPLVLLGPAAVLVGAFLTRGQSWAAVTGAGIGAALVCAAIGWTVTTLSSWIFSPLLVLVLAASLAAAAVLPFTIVPAIRVTRAQRSLGL